MKASRFAYETRTFVDFEVARPPGAWPSADDGRCDGLRPAN